MGAGTISRSLPYYSTPLLGRESECAQIEDMVRDPSVRLLTITGSAGIGKTRLAVTMANQLEEIGADGVVFVPLASVLDASLVAAEIARAHGLTDDDPKMAVHACWANWQGLVVLDNMEQVVEAASDIAEMLPANPELTLLVTSQRPLLIDGEHVLRLNPLALPEGDSTIESAASMQLLVERAAAQDATFLDSINEPDSRLAVAEICRQLDGIPLAIELAASRLASLSPEVVLAQLEQGQQILSTQRRDVPERHRTMQAAITWSTELLPEDTRRLFVWLGVFTAGFNLEIVEKVSRHLGSSAGGIDTISELMHLNLVRRVQGGADPWYSMLVSIREFCLAELDATGERDDAEALAAEYVLELAYPTDTTSPSHLTPEWYQLIEVHFPTIRSAVNWSLMQHQPGLPMLVGYGIARYLEQTGQWKEGVRWITDAEAWTDALSASEHVSGLLGKLEMQCTGRDLVGATETQATLGKLLQKHDLPYLEADFLVASGALATRKHHLDDAEVAYTKAVEISDRLGLEHNVAKAQTNLGHLAYLRGDFHGAETYLSLGLAAMQSVGNYSGAGTALQMLANVANIQDQTEKALRYVDEAIQVARDHNFPLDLMHYLLTRTASLADLEKLDEAIQLAAEVVEMSQVHDHPDLGADALHMMGALSHEQEDYVALGGYFLAAMNLTNVSRAPRMFAEMGDFLASGLAKSGYFSEAASILGGHETFVEAMGYYIRPDAEERRSGTLALVTDNLQGADAAISIGRDWTTQEWVSRLKQYARKLANTSTFLLVTIPEPEPFPALTARESEVVRLLADGHSTRGMADALSVSPRTITTHIGNIMGKLEVNSRTELIAKVLREGTF